MKHTSFSRNKFVICLFLVLLSACKVPYYFPLNDSSKEKLNDSLSNFVNTWYSKNLYALQEPILKDLNSEGVEIYRYTNIGTWSNSYSYRIEKKKDRITITKKRSSGQGGYNPGALAEEEVKSVSQEEWHNLLEKLGKIDFWSLSTHEESFGLDGEEWIIEGYKDQKYHFVTRWTPDYYGVNDYVVACKLFEEIFKKK